MAAGIDYAWGTPPYDEFVKQGIVFVMRYISHDTNKDLSDEELTELWKRGIGVGVVFETTATRPLNGYNAGVQDAQLALARCDALGLKDIPVYFAADFDATDRQKPTIGSYLQGAASVLGKNRVGVYGGYYVVKYMSDTSACSWFWQTYAWSGGLVHPSAHILQWKNGVKIGGLSCDLDKSLKADYGVIFPGREPAPYLREQTGYWSWVQWRLGEEKWFGWGYANPFVRPNVPKLIVPLWWARLRLFLAAREK
jgi:glycoside hydrolase-like protein